MRRFYTVLAILISFGAFAQPIGSVTRLSDVAADGSTAEGSADVSLAYSTTSDVYLTVYSADETDNEFGIYGQLVNSTTGAEISPNDFAIVASTTGEDHEAPVVVYNSTNDEFLVVWDALIDQGGTPTYKIYARRVDTDGTLLGAGAIEVASIASPSQLANPDVTYNATDNEFLVVYDATSTFSIVGQLLNGTDGSLSGGTFTLSDNNTVPNEDAKVAWNNVDNEYLVVWVTSGSGIAGANEIYGQLLDNTGADLGASTDFIISNIGPATTATDARNPDIIFDSTNNQYFVVYSGDPVNASYQIYGRLLTNNSSGVVTFNTTETAYSSNNDADYPTVTYNSLDDEFIIAFIDVKSLDRELYGQRVDNAGVETGTDDFVLIQTGTDSDGFEASNRFVGLSSGRLSSFLVANSSERSTVAGEIEVFSQLYGVAENNVSIVRTDANPTNATTVNFTVTTTLSTTGLSNSSFSLTNSGITGSSISAVTGSGTNFNVEVSTGSGDGTIRLDLTDGTTGVTPPIDNAPYISGQSYDVDLTPPTLTTSSPADGDVNVLLSQDIILTFDDDISKGTGNIVIRLSSDNSAVETIDVTTGAVSVATNQATINPTMNLVRAENYYIEIDNGAFENQFGDAYAGISGATTLNFSTVDVVINEIVTDPQQDWSTNSFDGTVGAGVVNQTDEYIELYINTAGIDFTGWTIELNDGTNVSGDLTNSGAFQNSVYYSSGTGTFANTEIGDFLVLGDVVSSGEMDSNITILLKDPGGAIVDEVTLGGGAGEAPSGASTGINDEAVFRQPNGSDTDADDVDFIQGIASLGSTNVANNKPTTSNNSVNINEGVVFYFASANFPFSDADGAQSLQAIEVTTLPGVGDLFYDDDNDGINDGGAFTGDGNGGEVLSAGDALTIAEIVELAYSSTSASSSFTFRVSDGIDFSDPPASTMTLTVNESPTVTVEQEGSQDDPTNTFPILFVATFNEAIDGSSFVNGDVTVNFTGTGTPTATVTEIAPNDQTTYQISIAQNDVSTSGDITVSLAADVINDAGGATNKASTSTDNTVTYDIDAPPAPNTPDLQAASDNGSSTTDNITSDDTPTFDGSGAEANSTVTLYSDNPAANTVIGSATADPSGNWTITSIVLSVGTHSITATSTDAAGNESPASGALSVQIVEVPTISASSWLDSDGDGDVDQVQIDFSTNVDINDTDGSGFNAIIFSGEVITITEVDYSVGSVTSLTLDITPLTGTADRPGVTIVYDDANASSIATSTGGIEIADGNSNDPDDAAPPVITSVIVDQSNQFADVTLSEMIYGDNSQTTAITDSDISISLSGGTANTPVVSSIKDTDNTDEGAASNVPIGATEFRIFFSYSGNADGTEILTVEPLDNTSVFGEAGNAMVNPQLAPNNENEDNLEPSVIPAITSVEWYDIDLDGSIDRASIYFSIDVRMVEPGGGDNGDGMDCFIIQYNGSNITQDGFKYDGNAIRDINVGSPLELNFTGGSQIPGTSLDLISLEYDDTQNDRVIAQSGGAEVVSAVIPPSNFVDEAAPHFDNFTATIFDTDEDGFVDEIVVNAADNINDAVIDPSEFTYNGVASSGVLSSTITDQEFTLAFNDFGTAPTGDFVYSGTSVEDNNSNQSTTGTIAQANILDEAAPVIYYAETNDSDNNGQIDQVTVAFTEAIDDVGSTSKLVDVDGFNNEVESATTADDEFLTFDFDESGSPDTDATPNILIAAGNIEDADGNVTVSLQTFTETTDKALPVLINAMSLDNDQEGNVDWVEIEFSEPVNDLDFLPAIGDWSMSSDGGSTSDSFTSFISGVGNLAVDNDNNDEFLTLKLVPDNVSGTGEIELRYQNGGIDIQDLASNTLADIPFTVILDGALPVLQRIEWYNDISADGNIDRAEVYFSESIAINDTGADDAIIINDGSTDHTVTSISLDLANSVIVDFSGDQISGTGITGLNVSYDNGSTTFDIVESGGTSAEAIGGTATLEYVDFADPVILTVDDNGGDNNYRSGETITFSTTVSEDVTATIDLTPLNSGFNNAFSLSGSGGSYSGTNGADASTMNEGSFSLTFSVEDAAGNTASDGSLSVTVDNTNPIGSLNNVFTNVDPPTISGTGISDAITATANLIVEVQIDGTGFNAATNPGDGTWSYTPGGGIGDGTYDLDLRITDEAGNQFTESITDGLKIDTDPPGVAITRNTTVNGTVDATNDDMVSFSVAFDEEMDDGTVEITDFNLGLSGATADALAAPDLVNSGDNQNYTINVNNVAGDGTISLSISASAASDPAGNAVPMAVSSADFTIDNTGPTTLTITRDDATPTNASTVAYSVDFNEDIDASTLVISDFTVTTVSGDATAVVGNITEDSPGVFTVTLNSVDGNGDLRLDFAGSVNDEAGNLYNTPVDGEIYLIDNVLPLINSLTFSPSGPTDADPIVATIVWSEDITGFAIADGDIDVTGATESNLVTSVANTSFTFDLSASGDGTISVFIPAGAIADDAGNQNLISDTYEVEYDDSAPIFDTETVTTFGKEATLTFDLDETGTVYYVILDGGAAPSVAQVVAGQDGSGGTANLAASGSVSVTSPAFSFQAVETLANATNYTTYYVSEDGIGNQSTVNNISILTGGAFVATTGSHSSELCIEGDAVAYDNDIVIQETLNSDFRQGDNITIRLEAPAGFEFNTSTIPTVTPTVSSGASDISDASASFISSTLLRISFDSDISNDGYDGVDIITISGLETVAVGTTEYPAGSEQELKRVGGTADLYGLNESDDQVFGTLTSKLPFNAPLITNGGATPVGQPYIVDDKTGNANTTGNNWIAYFSATIAGAVNSTSPIDINAVSAGNTIRIYTDEALTTEVSGSGFNSSASYSPTLSDFDLTAASVGINNFWITVTDAATGCESTATKYSIGIINVSNSAGTTTFSQNAPGTTLSASEPDGHNGLYTGNGLSNFVYDNNGSNSNIAEVDFVPAGAGDGSHLVQYQLSDNSGASVKVQISFTVVGSVTVFNSGNLLSFCFEDQNQQLNIKDPDTDKSDDDNTDGIPNFYNIKVFEVDNGSRGAELTGTLLVSRPTPVDGQVTSTDPADWIFNPTDYAQGVDGDTLEFAMTVQDESTLSLSDDYAVARVIINPLPEVEIQNVKSYYCADDASFNINVDIGGTVRNATNGYRLDRLESGSYVNKAVAGSAQFDPSLAATSFGLGEYRIIFESLASDNASGCINTDSVFFEILSKPAKPTLATDLSGIGWLDTGTDEYLLEFCAGDIIPDLEAIGDSIIWFDQALNELASASNTLTAETLFGSSTAIANLNRTIFFSDNTDVDINSSGFEGCASELRKLVIRSYANPDIPTLDLSSSDALARVDVGEYIYEYCDGDAYDPVELNPTLQTDGESYFVIYDRDENQIGITTSTTLDLTAAPFNLTGAVASDTYYISQTNKDNSFESVDQDDINDEFTGCNGETMQLVINTYDIPDVPDNTDFAQGGYSGFPIFYVCQGDDMEDIEAPILPNDRSYYVWYQDDGTGTAPSTTEITVSNRIGEVISQEDLEDASVTVDRLDVNVPGDYVYWVRLFDDENDVTDFIGCPSDAIRITVRVYEDPDSPEFTDPGVTFVNLNTPSELAVSFCEGDIAGSSFTVTGNTDAIFNIYRSDEDRNQSTLLFTLDGSTGTASISAGNLQIIDAQEDTLYFLISQVNNIDPNSAGVGADGYFEGCETEVDDMAYLIVNVYDVPDVPETDGAIAEATLNDESVYYYCEPDIDASGSNGITAVGEVAGGEFRWYSEEAMTNQIHTGETIPYSVLQAELGLSGTDANNDYRIWVTQTLEIGNGVSTFEGCTSPPREIVIYEQPPAPELATFEGNLISSEFCLDDLTSGPVFIEIDAITGARFVIYDGNQNALDTITNTNYNTGVDFVTTDMTFFVSQITNISGQFPGCESDLTQIQFTVYPNPVEPDIDITAGNIPTNSEASGDTQNGYLFEFCEGDAVPTDLISISNSTAQRYEWYTASAGGEEITSINNGQSVSLQEIANETQFDFNENGTVSIFVEAISNQCISLNRTQVTIQVGTPPLPEIIWEGITAGQETIIRFYQEEATVDSADVTEMTYQIRDASLNLIDFDTVDHLIDSVVLTIANPGDYTIDYSMQTTATCVTVNTRTIKILRQVNVDANTGYLAEFEDDSEGWFREYRDNSGREDDRAVVWEIGTPTTNLIGGAYEGTGAWATNLTGNYEGPRHDWVYSPAFNLTGLVKPIVSFYHKHFFTDFRDGVVFQYSTDNGQSWVELGVFDEDEVGGNEEVEEATGGLGWHTNSDIASAPGTFTVNMDNPDVAEVSYNQASIGWADNQSDQANYLNDWIYSSHLLDDIDGSDNIRFRFAFSSNTGEATDEGFAFDNFRIFEGEKTVLLETFSSTQTQTSKVGLDSALSEYSNVNGVVWINYFTNLGNGAGASARDIINLRNPNGPAARSGFYGVSEVPKSVIEGDVRENGTSNDELLGWSEKDLQKAGLLDKGFTINNWNIGLSEGVLSISASFTSEVEIDDPDSEISIRFVVIEREVTGIDNGVYAPSDILYNVFRKVLPKPSGILKLGAISMGQTFDESVTWKVEDLYSPDQVSVIAFVQNERTKEVYQVAQMDAPVIPSSEITLAAKDLGKATGFDVYPNPGDEQVNIQFALPTFSDMNWVIFDQTGKEVAKGSLVRGTRELSVYTKDFPSGLYMVHIFNEQDQWKPKRLLIIH